LTGSVEPAERTLRGNCQRTLDDSGWLPGMAGRVEVTQSQRQAGCPLVHGEGLRHAGRVDIRRKTFAAEAASRLGFLIRHGFAGPEVTREGDYPLLIRVSYHRSDLDVRESLILSYGGEEYVMADVVHLNPAGGPAMRTNLSEATAHTGFQMRQALDRQAQVLREFLSRQQPGPRPT
jgi:hypothetical protein